MITTLDNGRALLVDEKTGFERTYRNVKGAAQAWADRRRRPAVPHLVHVAGQRLPMWIVARSSAEAVILAHAAATGTPVRGVQACHEDRYAEAGLCRCYGETA